MYFPPKLAVALDYETPVEEVYFDDINRRTCFNISIFSTPGVIRSDLAFVILLVDFVSDTNGSYAQQLGVYNSTTVTIEESDCKLILFMSMYSIYIIHVLALICNSLTCFMLYSQGGSFIYLSM